MDQLARGFTVKGHIFAILSVFLGGMFSFPYLLLATYRANGDPKKILLGIHAPLAREPDGKPSTGNP